MLNKIYSIAQSNLYWLALIILGLFLETTALIYQYALDYRPCVMCIQVRLWIICFVLIALIAMTIKHTWKLSALMHILNTLVMAALLERSYQLLGTERGWTFGSCDFDLGLPAWFDVESWLPAVFKVWEPCGYTPEIVFGITMAETLLGIFILMFTISVVLTISVFVRARQ